MENNIKIPQMRTIKETAALFGLPVHFVRQKVNAGEVVAVRAGKKFLVNVDRFLEYLNSATVTQTTESPSGERLQKTAVGENPRISPIPLR